jgi:hypothetical protein
MIKEFKIAAPNKKVNSSVFRQETGCELFTKDDGFYISGCETQAEADTLIAAHNPPAPTEPTVVEKLASVGLSVDDLKEALGL